jgi:hypothetical protein
VWNFRHNGPNWCISNPELETLLEERLWKLERMERMERFQFTGVRLSLGKMGSRFCSMSAAPGLIPRLFINSFVQPHSKSMS